MSHLKICQGCKEEFQALSIYTTHCHFTCKRKYSKSRLWVERRKEVLERDGFKCVYCGVSPSEDEHPIEVDHVIPRSKGGSDELNNLVASCKSCNSTKRDAGLTEEQSAKIRELFI